MLVSGASLCAWKPAGYSLGFDFMPESNRVFPSGVSFSSFGSLSLHTIVTVRAGVSLGVLGQALDIKAFGKADLSVPLKTVPLVLSLHYIYNGLPKYKTHSHTALPLVSLNGRWAGTAIGPAWHFTLFNREAVIIEPVFALSSYINAYHTERGRVGLRVTNITDFVSGTMGSYSLTLYSAFGLSRRCFIINEVTLYQSGSVGLAATYYGFSYRGGLVFKW